MNKFIWTKEYELGVEVIDSQHKHFFEIVNRIYDTLENKETGSADIQKIINELTEYALFHLGTEEKYFNQFAYSDQINHMKYHNDFRIKSGDYSDRIKDPKEDVTKLALEITDFAKNWLQHHILVADKAYAPFFQAHGL